MASCQGFYFLIIKCNIKVIKVNQFMDTQKGAWLLAILGAVMIILVAILLLAPAHK